MATSGLQLAKLAAVVTGGGSGIGRAICKRFAKEGARIAIVDFDGNHAIQTLDELTTIDSNCKHHAFTTDVTDAESVAKQAKSVAERFPDTPTILVNCAGIVKDSFMTKMDDQTFDDVISVNLKGVFLVTRAFSRMMIENKIKHGSIINMSSISGKTGNIGQCNYTASKAGVEGFTRTIAKELAKYDIRCNAVLPGWIDTSMTRAVPEKVLTKHLGMIPAGKLGQPEEVADTCLFLASQRSSYITGTSIEVTGGLFM